MAGNRNRGGGRDSKNFRGGSNPHIGAPRSQSGSQNFDRTPRPQRGRGPSIGEQIAGYRYPTGGGGYSGGSSGGKRRKKR